MKTTALRELEKYLDRDPSLKKSPWARIWRAAQKSSGVRLSAEDCARLIQDDAIAVRGKADDDGLVEGWR